MRKLVVALLVVEAGLAAACGFIVLRIQEIGRTAPARMPAGESELVWFDRAGRTIERLRAPGKAVDVRLSPDHRAVLCNVLAPGRSSIWRIPLEGGAISQVTPDGVRTARPVWSPDGRRFAYMAWPGGRIQIRQSASASSGDELLVGAQEDASAVPEDWSPEGGLLYSRFYLSARHGLWILPLRRPGEPQYIAAAGDNAYEGRFSPDGRWIAFTTLDSGQEEVQVATVGAGQARRVSPSGGHSPQWAHSGEEIFYIDQQGCLAAAPWKDGAAGTPIRLFALPARDPAIEFGYRFGGFAPDPQGRRFLVALEKNAPKR